MAEQSTQSAPAAKNPFFEGIKSAGAQLFGTLTESIGRAGSQAIPIWVNKKFGSDQDSRQLQDTTYQWQHSQPRIEHVTFSSGPASGGNQQKTFFGGFSTAAGTTVGLGFAALLALVLITRK